jgi:hypothetical protein
MPTAERASRLGAALVTGAQTKNRRPCSERRLVVQLDDPACAGSCSGLMGVLLGLL